MVGQYWNMPSEVRGVRFWTGLIWMARYFKQGDEPRGSVKLRECFEWVRIWFPRGSLLHVVGAHINGVCSLSPIDTEDNIAVADPSELYWGIIDVLSVHMHALISTMSKQREITGTFFMATIEFSSGVRFESLCDR
jgi:hypothetical protein